MDCKGNIGASTFLIGLWDAKILRWGLDVDCRGFSATAKSSTYSTPYGVRCKIDCSRRYLDGVLETGSRAASSLASSIVPLRCYCKHCASAHLNANAIGA